MQDYSEVEMEKLAVMLSQRQDLHIDPLVVPLIVAASRGIPHRLDLMITRLARFRTGRVTEEDATEILAPYGFRAGMRQPFDALEQMQQLTGKQFEELITTVLARSGFRCQMTRASGDGGIDIVAVLDKPLVGGKYLIQCKRYSPGILVGSPIVREFYGAVSADPEAVKGILVTTSGYTEEARKFAQAVGIELIDITRLKALVTENGMWGATSPKPKPGLFDG
jgi:hypothetical protein